MRGKIFENFIVSEYHKNNSNQGKTNNLYFWRDQKGHEIDLIEDRSSYLFPIEIKLAQTFNTHFIKNINYFNKLQKESSKLLECEGKLIYCGDQELSFKSVDIKNWRNSLKL